MNSPLLDASSVTPSPATSSLNPRQKLENTLSQEPAAAGTAAAKSESNKPSLVTRDELLAPVQRINESMSNTGVEFQVAEPGKRLVTRVVDRESGEVIRQFPSEEVLRIAENLEKMSGRLLQEKA
ncbi:MAG: flagellar protein FlaG [Pseudomonas sp.]